MSMSRSATYHTTDERESARGTRVSARGHGHHDPFTSNKFPPRALREINKRAPSPPFLVLHPCYGMPPYVVMTTRGQPTAHNPLQMGKHQMSNAESTGRIEISISNSRGQEVPFFFSRDRRGRGTHCNPHQPREVPGAGLAKHPGLARVLARPERPDGAGRVRGEKGFKGPGIWC